MGVKLKPGETCEIKSKVHFTVPRQLMVANETQGGVELEHDENLDGSRPSIRISIKNVVLPSIRFRIKRFLLSMVR